MGGKLRLRPHREGVRAATRLEFATAACELARYGDAREPASVTAFGQPVDVCAELVAAAEPLDREFLTCLVQELVLRFEHLDREPFASFWHGIQLQGHPLGWLPPQLSTIEASILLPWYRVDGMAGGMAGPLVEAGSAGAGEEPRAAPLERETTAPTDTKLITAAVATWLEASNGRAEARVFALRAGEARRSLAAVLADAGLECLGRAPPSRVVPVAPGDAFAVLFSAAAGGGAYESGRYGAYGRLAAWQTLSALAGAPSDQPIEDVAELAERTRWFGFATDSGWFYDVAWYMVITAVSADGKRLAMLAATDTD